MRAARPLRPTRPLAEDHDAMSGREDQTGRDQLDQGEHVSSPFRDEIPRGDDRRLRERSGSTVRAARPLRPTRPLAEDHDVMSGREDQASRDQLDQGEHVSSPFPGRDPSRRRPQTQGAERLDRACRPPPVSDRPLADDHNVSAGRKDEASRDQLDQGGHVLLSSLGSNPYLWRRPPCGGMTLAAISSLSSASLVPCEMSLSRGTDRGLLPVRSRHGRVNRVPLPGAVEKSSRWTDNQTITAAARTAASRGQETASRSGAFAAGPAGAAGSAFAGRTRAGRRERVRKGFRSAPDRRST